jgi:ATP-binding cassette subfamily G (WHITE) protein 8 (sterolin 2)
VCLLDEPTTGLDAFTARHVVETLQDLAHKTHRTVVMSIHQPRYDVFALIDDVILLSRGRQIWSGPSRRMLDHFETTGHPCPSLTNPADFILDISSIDVSGVINFIVFCVFICGVSFFV